MTKLKTLFNEKQSELLAENHQLNELGMNNDQRLHAWHDTCWLMENMQGW